MQIEIKGVYITEMQEKTWGRVYMVYVEEHTEKYIFKNWLKFKEKTYKGEGNIVNEPSFTWVNTSLQHFFSDYLDVLNGKADNLNLTTPNFKNEYGTPSVILQKLLIELKANIGESVANRRGWFLEEQNKQVVLSSVLVNPKGTITLVDYFNYELKFEPILKTLYLFFLQHLEGCRLSELYLHKTELLDIYTLLNPNKNKEKMQETIDVLVTVSNNSLHEKISKIKNKIKSELNEDLCNYYAITGVPGEKYMINLPFNLVVLNH